MSKPFRFGCQAYQATSRREWVELARRVEAQGYSTLHVADHYIGPGPALAATGHRVQTLAAVPAMAVAAEVTSTLLIGSRLFCAGYHHPVVLAKEAATLDLLSGGRLELGLGAGWLEREYTAMGIPFPAAAERIGLLRETIELIEQCFSGRPVDFAGQYLRASGFSGAPDRSSRPPLIVGGGGRNVLRLAGEKADIVSINFNNRAGTVGADSARTSTAEQTANKISWVREGAGDRFDRLELEIGAYFVAVSGSASGPADPAAIGARLGLNPEELAEFPHALIGSVDEICETLERRREQYGLSYVTVGSSVADSFAPVVERLNGK